MKASGLDIAVLESPKMCATGEKKTWTMDFSAVGTPSSILSVKAYDPSGADVSGTVLDGLASLNGAVATLKAFIGPSTEGLYFIVCEVNIGNNEIMGGLYVAVFPVARVPTSTAAYAYGTVAGVAALVPRYGNKSGTFGDTTNPQQAEVVNLINQVSSMLNVQLSQNGFTVPITDAGITPMLSLFVNEEVASIIEGINGLGRFSPRGKTGASGSRFRIITKDVAEFIEANVQGMADMGAERPEVLASGIGFRDTDEGGRETFPLFQRRGYGDSEFQKNWDE